MHHRDDAMHHGTAHDAHGAAIGHGAADGIEWEDDMLEVNRLTTRATMPWRFLDRTGVADNPTIDWRFRVGDRVKIRLVNEMESNHPMHHPFHLHWAGRFLVLARDGVVEPNLAWKDTVLVRTGQTVDIMFDVTNPGLWIAQGAWSVCRVADLCHRTGWLADSLADSEQSAALGRLVAARWLDRLLPEVRRILMRRRLITAIEHVAGPPNVPAKTARWPACRCRRRRRRQ